MPAPSMATPERELRKDYDATQQMQVTQLQTEYAQRGFTILRGATDLEGVRRDVWAAYDSRTGDTYVFSRTRESSFGTGQSVLDAVGKWVDKQNGGIAMQNIGEGISAQASNREFQELGTDIEARRRAREQPAQAATETPVRAGARTTEGGERRGTVVMGEGEQVKEEERAALPSQPSRGGVETREIVRGTPVDTQRTGRPAEATESFARISLTYGPAASSTEEHFFIRAADQQAAANIEREYRRTPTTSIDVFLAKYKSQIVGVDVDALIQRIHES